MYFYQKNVPLLIFIATIGSVTELIARWLTQNLLPANIFTSQNEKCDESTDNSMSDTPVHRHSPTDDAMTDVCEDLEETDMIQG